MKCEVLRERLAQDPARGDGEFERHAETCPACRAFGDRLMRTEALIQEALRFDVKALAGNAAGDGQKAMARSGWVTLTSGIAAGLLAGIAIWTMFGGGEARPDALAAEIAEHWFNEPESWVETDLPVSRDVLANVLGADAVIDLAALNTVSYAESCYVGGEWIPHLVVQGEQGPYMVLLMPGRTLQSRVPVRLPEQGLAGHIIPAGTGAIAVMGGESPELEQMEASLIDAVSWSI